MLYNTARKTEVAKRTLHLSEYDLEEMDMEIRENIEKMRIDRNFSYDDLAEITGIGKSYLYRILSGSVKNFSLRHVYKIMFALNIMPEDIFPKKLIKRQTMGQYGEEFEYLIKNMTDQQVQFLMGVVEMYAESIDSGSVETEERSGECHGEDTDHH